jgi:hypothetical protein
MALSRLVSTTAIVERGIETRYGMLEPAVSEVRNG